MDLREWAIKSWRYMKKLQFARNTTKYGRSYYTGLTQFELEFVISSIIDVLIEELANGGEVRISKLGRFDVVERPERVVSNNMNGKRYQVEARRVVRFRPSEYLKREIRMNKEYVEEP